MSDVSLRDYIDRRFEDIRHSLDERQKRVDVTFGQHEHALSIARLELERRLLSMNEFREQLTRQAGEFASKELLSVKFDEVRHTIALIQTAQSRIIAYASVAGSVAGVVVGLVMFLISRMMP